MNTAIYPAINLVLCAALVAAIGCGDSAIFDTDLGLSPDQADHPEVDAGAQVADAAMQNDSDPGLAEPLVRDPQAVCPTGYQTTQPQNGLNKAFVVDGQDRRFYLKLPDAETFTGPRPVMFYFHGTGGKGTEFSNTTAEAAMIAAGFIVVGPYGELNGTIWPEWDGMRDLADETRPNRDVALFDTLLDCLAGHFPVDAKRIYISGISAGGIMVNRLLRTRSTILAGGIAASGVFELTGTSKPEDLDAMAVVVTWGGDNDEWGGKNGGKEVPGINFAEQSALASQHYEAAPKVNQVYCRGHELGHAWLSSVEPFMIEFLTAHPKGKTKSSSWTFVEPGASNATCGEGAATATQNDQIICSAEATPGCGAYCQMFADCVVENTTVKPILAPQITAFGFGGADQSDCSGCISLCDADVTAGGSVDTAVLDCVELALQAQQCGAGILGALTLADNVNSCCAGNTASAICTRLCTEVLKNTVAQGFFPGCDAWK